MTFSQKENSTGQQSIVHLSIKLFENIPKIISSLISLTVLAYITGWIEAKAYFGSFGAEWLVSELNSVMLLQFSWLPLVYLCLFIWLGIQDLESTKQNKLSRRWRYTIKFVRYGLIPLIIIVSIPDILFSRGYVTASVYASCLAWIGCIFYAGAAFECLIITYYNKILVWDAHDIKLALAVILFGLYFSPAVHGKMNGRLDFNPDSSHLPVIETIKTENQNLRLIFISGNKVYTANLKKDNPKNTEVRILNTSDVTLIKHYKNRDKTK